jgi:membrane-associated phospholipid phosphatase
MNVRHPGILRLIPILLAAAVLASALTPGRLWAEPLEGRDPYNHLGVTYVKKFFVDFGHLAVSPAHWKGADFLILGGTVAGTAALFTVDDQIADWVMDHHSTSSGWVPRTLSHLAEPPFLGSTIAAIYLSGEIFDSKPLRRVGLLCLEAYGANAIISSFIKFLVGRARYSAGEGDRSFHPFSFNFISRSFPSGHSGSFFAFAAVLAGEVDKPLVGALLYTLAGAVAVSRIHDNDHWASDILAGSVLGYVIGKAVLHLNRPSTEGGPSLSVGPGPGGFSLSLRF